MTLETKSSILVVEDNDQDFEIIARIIQRTGLADVVRALNGDDGLALLRSPDARSRAALVLLDLHTPGSDGHDVLREIKSDEALKRIPVIIFTASSNPRDVERCYSKGANSYHIKPLDLGGFETIVLEIANYWLSRVLLTHDKEG
jgi:CheY-like chemotaxis protein